MTTLLFYLPCLLIYVIFAVYLERKISAFIQDRLGPMEVGPYGLVQTVADLVKFLQKEDIVPVSADRRLFKAAPVVLFVVVFMGFAVLPVASAWPGAGLSTGVFFLVAVVSLDVIAILVAGWASGNKYSTLGAFRSAAQIISYEIPLGIAILCPCLMAGTLDLSVISAQQAGGPQVAANFLGIPGLAVGEWGGFFTWNIFRTPLLLPAWVLFFIASLAECNRAPFDLPEAESELVAGYHTEYSGFRWATLMLAEYGMMLLVSLLGAILFFGGWNSPLPNIGGVRLGDWTSGPAWVGAGWLLAKSFVFVAVQMWVRWTYPRLRVDQLMNVGWKYLTPIGLVLLIFCAIWRLVNPL